MTVRGVCQLQSWSRQLAASWRHYCCCCCCCWCWCHASETAVGRRAGRTRIAADAASVCCIWAASRVRCYTERLCRRPSVQRIDTQTPGRSFIDKYETHSVFQLHLSCSLTRLPTLPFADVSRDLPAFSWRRWVSWQYIGWKWCNFVPYLCQLVFAAILWVNVFFISVFLLWWHLNTLCR